MGKLIQTCQHVEVSPSGPPTLTYIAVLLLSIPKIIYGTTFVTNHILNFNFFRTFFKSSLCFLSELVCPNKKIEIINTFIRSKVF